MAWEEEGASQTRPRHPKESRTDRNSEFSVSPIVVPLKKTKNKKTHKKKKRKKKTTKTKGKQKAHPPDRCDEECYDLSLTPV